MMSTEIRQVIAGKEIKMTEQDKATKINKITSQLEEFDCFTLDKINKDLTRRALRLLDKMKLDISFMMALEASKGES